MDSNIVLDAVRRSNRTMLLLGLGVLALVIIGATIDKNQLISFFAGPREMATQELVQVDDAGRIERYWVTVKGSSVIDTGWQNYTESDSGTKTINSSYAALAV